MSEETIAERTIGAALALLKWAEGDIELASTVWGEAFEEAERIDHNQSLDQPDDLGHTVLEQTEHFERAKQIRKKFHVVPPGSE